MKWKIAAGAAVAIVLVLFLADGMFVVKPDQFAIVTEFGRTVRPNGSGGTDHGTGTIAMLAGGAVEGGRVLTRWPGLDPTRLLDGRDLAPTTDLRAVLKAVLEQHLGLPADGVARMVFPHSDEAAALSEIVRA